MAAPGLAWAALAVLGLLYLLWATGKGPRE